MDGARNEHLKTRNIKIIGDRIGSQCCEGLDIYREWSSSTQLEGVDEPLEGECGVDRDFGGWCECGLWQLKE